MGCDSAVRQQASLDDDAVGIAAYLLTSHVVVGGAGGYCHRDRVGDAGGDIRYDTADDDVGEA